MKSYLAVLGLATVGGVESLKLRLKAAKQPKVGEAQHQPTVLVSGSASDTILSFQCELGQVVRVFNYDEKKPQRDIYYHHFGKN